jgi:hypothetical protein
VLSLIYIILEIIGEKIDEEIYSRFTHSLGRSVLFIDERFDGNGIL